MSNQEHEGELIRALEFAYRNPMGFTKEQLAEHLKTDHGKWGDVLKHQFGGSNSSSEKDRLFLSNRDNGQYALSVEGTKMFFDVIEIQEAKKQAKSADRLAKFSIGISIVGVILTAIIQIYTTTTIEFTERQLLEIQRLMGN